MYASNFAHAGAGGQTKDSRVLTMGVRRPKFPNRYRARSSSGEEWADVVVRARLGLATGEDYLNNGMKGGHRVEFRGQWGEFREALGS